MIHIFQLLCTLCGQRSLVQRLAEAPTLEEQRKVSSSAALPLACCASPCLSMRKVCATRSCWHRRAARTVATVLAGVPPF